MLNIAKHNYEDLQDSFLQDLIHEQRPVYIYLINGIKLEGKVINADQHCIVLGGHSSQLLFKHSISTIMPACDEHGRPIRHERFKA